MGCGSSRGARAPSEQAQAPARNKVNAADAPAAQAHAEARTEAHREPPRTAVAELASSAVAERHAHEAEDESAVDGALEAAELGETSRASLAKALGKTLASAASLNFADMSLGLKVMTHWLRSARSTLALADAPAEAASALAPPAGTVCKDKRLALLFDSWMPYIDATYCASAAELEAVLEACGGARVLECDLVSAAGRPGYYVALCPRMKKVLLAVRGTAKAADALTDAAAAAVQSGESVVHGGMQASALGLMERVVPGMLKACSSNKGFTLQFVGHSLGGGTATLVAIAAKARFPNVPVSCFVVAPAACVSADLAHACASYVTSLILQDDVVPRLSIGAVHRLNALLGEFPWRSMAASGAASKALAKAQAKTRAGDKMLASSRARERETDSAAAAALAAAGQRPTADDQLFAGGRVFHLRSEASDEWRLIECDPTAFRDVVLSPSMLRDHGLGEYARHLAQCISRM